MTNLITCDKLQKKEYFNMLYCDIGDLYKVIIRLTVGR